MLFYFFNARMQNQERLETGDSSIKINHKETNKNSTNPEVKY